MVNGQKIQGQGHFKARLSKAKDESLCPKTKALAYKVSVFNAEAKAVNFGLKAKTKP